MLSSASRRAAVSASSIALVSAVPAVGSRCCGGEVSGVAKGADCKSAASWLRRFESFLPHHASPSRATRGAATFRSGPKPISPHRRHTPPPGLAFREPNDRLQRGIQYDAAFRSFSITGVSGILGRPVKPGDDGRSVARVSTPSLRAQAKQSMGPRQERMDCFVALLLAMTSHLRDLAARWARVLQNWFAALNNRVRRECRAPNAPAPLAPALPSVLVARTT